MRGSSFALSSLLAAIILMAMPAQADDEVDGVMKCQCACACPNGSGGCTCDCACPEPASMCGPGFSRVCPMPASAECAPGLVAQCSGDLPEPVVVTAPPPSLVTETAKAPNFKCGKSTIKCDMTAKFMSDCSSVTSVSPKCTPKKTTCKKANFSLTVGECTITGTYKNSKGKQTASGLAISGGGGTAVTTAAPVASTQGPGCMCVPDFLLAFQQVVASQTPEYPCVCVAEDALA